MIGSGFEVQNVNYSNFSVFNRKFKKKLSLIFKTNAASYYLTLVEIASLKSDSDPFLSEVALGSDNI
jgi:hypothetical protein